jgi:hypothetical protein
MAKGRIPISEGKYCPLCEGIDLINKGTSRYDG